jgi:hypothetical protein
MKYANRGNGPSERLSYLEIGACMYYLELRSVCFLIEQLCIISLFPTKHLKFIWFELKAISWYYLGT